MKRSVISGAVAAVIMWFPVAIIVAVVYRFPIPFAGYSSGFSELHYVPLAVIFYGLLGGFLIVPAAGALGGWWSAKRGMEVEGSSRRLVYAISACIALAAAVFLAVVPW
jgi:hypothetical protein